MKKKSQNFFEENFSNFFEERVSEFLWRKRLSLKKIWFLSFYLKKKRPSFSLKKISDLLWRKSQILFEQKSLICVEENLRFSVSEKSHNFFEETGPDFLWRYLWEFMRKLNGGMLMDVLCILHIQNWSRPVWYSGQFWWMPCIHEKGLLHLDIWIQYLFDLVWHFNVFFW